MSSRGIEAACLHVGEALLCLIFIQPSIFAVLQKRRSMTFD
jgi:hypothetical protein